MCKYFYKILILILLCISLIPFISFKNTEKLAATRLKNVDYQKKLEVTGTIEASESIPVVLSYPVYIKECYVRENNYVNKGQLLFTIDTDKMLDAAKEYSFTGGNMNFDTNNTDMINIPANIYASESGVVSDIIAYSGSMVMAEEALCIIEKNDELILKINLNQDDYSAIEVGDIIIFNPAIAPAREYSGVVIDKTAVVRRETSLTGNKTVIDIFADIDFTDEYITQGLQFTGIILKPDTKSLYTLPYDFIFQDEKGEYVNIYSNGEILKKYIETGIETENYVEIKTNFDANTVFVKNNYKRKSLLEYNN